MSITYPLIVKTANIEAGAVTGEKLAEFAVWEGNFAAAEVNGNIKNIAGSSELKTIQYNRKELIVISGMFKVEPAEIAVNGKLFKFGAGASLPTVVHVLDLVNVTAPATTPIVEVKANGEVVTKTKLEIGWILAFDGRAISRI